MSANSSSKTGAVVFLVIVASGISISEAFQPRIRPTLLQQKVPSVRLFSEPHQEGSSSSTSTSRSIGDVVQGLHGSKYQFSSSGINFEGQQFAETGYGSAELEEEDYSDEPVPTWALKLKEIVPSNESPTLQLASGSGSVQIQNEERSWEKYYAFLIGDDIDTLVVEPSVGMLAPRGGTENFPDTAQLTVQGAIGAEGKAFLAVGTEAEKWVYKILLNCFL
jgi:hypothetical protein